MSGNIRVIQYGLGPIGCATARLIHERKNLDLVTDAYSRGAVSIIELVDAQNAALAADGAAANAVFEFLIDLMEAQRASNTLDFFLSDEQRASFFDAMHSFFEAGGLAPGR